MTPEQFATSVVVPTHAKPKWLQWYEVGMPAVLVAGIQHYAQTSYRSFATDLPELPHDHHTSDLFAVLRHFKSFRSGARNLPNWVPEFQLAWAEVAVTGQPFCMADVVSQLPNHTRDKFAQLFLDARLETKTHHNGLEYSTGLDYEYSNGHDVIGTLRAAMWLEFPSEVRAIVRSRVETWTPTLRDSARAKLAKLDASPVARYQLDWRTFGSYRRLSEQFDGFYARWAELPLAYRTPILDFVYRKATVEGLDASEYSSYNLFSRCSSYPEAGTFCRWVQLLHSAMDTSRLDWLLELSKLEPDPEKVAENWRSLKPKLVDALDDTGRHTLSSRVRNAHV